MGCRKSKPVAIENIQEDASAHHREVAGSTASMNFSTLQVENLRTAFEGLVRTRGPNRPDYGDRLTQADFSKIFSFEPGMADTLFRTFDVDNDGSIDMNEFISGFCFMCKGSVKEKAALLFSANDLDGNGTLDREEISMLLREIVSKMKRLQSMTDAEEDDGIDASDWAADKMDQIVDGLFTEYDENRDGVISRDEFCAFMCNNKLAQCYCAHIEQAAQQVLYSGINNPQSQKFWEDVRSSGGWIKGSESRAPPNTAIQQRRRGRKV